MFLRKVFTQFLVAKCSIKKLLFILLKQHSKGTHNRKQCNGKTCATLRKDNAHLCISTQESG